MNTKVLSICISAVISLGNLYAVEYGSLTITGSTNLQGNVNLGNQPGDSITSIGYFKTNYDTRLGDGAADTTTIYGTLNLANASISGNINALGTGNLLPNQGLLSTENHIVTRKNGDLRYAQISSLSAYLLAETANNAFIPVDGGGSITGDLTISSTLSAGFTSVDSLETEGNATVGGTFNVTGAATLASLNSNGNATVGGTLEVTGAATLTDISATGNLTTGGANNRLTNQQLMDEKSIITQGLGDTRYFNNNDAQIVIGNHEVADPNAAIIVGNGVDAQHPNNAFVVRQSGVVKIGDIQIDPVAGVVTVPERGDIDMGGYE